MKQQFRAFKCFEEFNRCDNPLKGLSIFQNAGMLSENPDEIVAFLVNNNANLNKDKIGELLGGNKDLNVKLLESYRKFIFSPSEVKKLDQSSPALYYISSLRMFLSYFKIQGEAQQIDRIMRQFSMGFSALPDVHLCQESAYILSFATMMLNTDIHNVAVERKMTCSDFVKNTKHGAKN